MNAYLFDVDGVITDPVTRNISKQQLVTHLITLLQKGNPIGIISGRGLIWLRSRIVKVLENYLNDHPGLDNSMLDNVYVSGEFNGVVCIHKNGERQEFVNREQAIPEEVKSGLHLIAFQFSEYVFVDQEKQTIFTVQANSSVNEKEFQMYKNDIFAGFEQVIASYPDLEVHADRLAINIRNKKANKHYATQQFLMWLSKKGLKPEKFYVFGDNPSDLEMGTALYEQGLIFEFVFVGETNELSKEIFPFNIIVTKGHCDTGTLEYLTEHNA